MYLVIDTERIKGHLIYLLSYQLYDDAFELVESRTYNDISIDVSNRKDPKKKIELLKNQSIKVNSFNDIYSVIRPILDNSVNIFFSNTDIGAFKTNCKLWNIEYQKITYIDLQKILYKLSTDKKHKSNLDGYCKKHNIKHDAHIPESDCEVTFILFKNLLKEYGLDFVNSFLRQS